MIRTLVSASALVAALSLSGAAMAQDAAASSTAAPTTAAPASDPYLWLEEIEGERAMEWVEGQNDRSLGVLQGDPRYQGLYDQALALVEAQDRIPMPGLVRTSAGEVIDNFWQDAEHVRGIWRTTSVDSYLTDDPQWETILDIDALAEAEGKNWVYKGASCLAPDNRRCLVFLSDGGKDAVVTREFDRDTRQFVENGFNLPESKGGATWVDENTLLISQDFGPDTLTDSGYPLTVRRLMRGQAPSEAVELFRGEKADVASSAYTLRDADGVLQAVLIDRSVGFYDAETHLLEGDVTRQLPLPSKVQIEALLDDQLVFTTNEDWTAPNGQAFATGDLIAWNLEGLKTAPDTTPLELILRPGEREAIESVSATRNRLVVAMTENVRGGVYSYSRGDDGAWTRQRLALPENVTVGIGSASDLDDRVFVTAANYLTPSTLYLADAASLDLAEAKSLPEKFDAEGLTIQQFEAASKDGTRIPYFVVHREAMPMDGSSPTLLYGYGGFQSSLLPGYSATVGKLWLERGGVYVVANTRGGGEFGPRWHQAALQENRQRAHEDFQAVAEDVIRRGVTSQPHLGIMGGSQGGLFMGAMLTQRPDLINAAVIQVPLFDMLRFHKLLAGASWIAEYGNPDIPEERAWIEEYSPYQRLSAEADYPEVFIHTSTKDDRVHPGHARKAAARMIEQGHEVLFYENTDGGHAAGANLRETARRLALEYTYLTRRLMDEPAQD
ncbi:prolyl oligopeptidase family serine peptidase [Brevundimonas lutea]|uniref:prolyl oligopeptidase family serine peptidase n=1 Tax=Brevundimonas lutea TaxID=2293980 RepID=UPI000F01816F|nr:prolyl oligopeptidase family serine peptidase [Brevundimonas lutea]